MSEDTNFKSLDKKAIIKKKLTPEQFIEEFNQTLPKLSQKIDIKQVLDEQIEERVWGNCSEFLPENFDKIQEQLRQDMTKSLKKIRN